MSTQLAGRSLTRVGVSFNGEEPRVEGAWGDGQRFVQRGNWAMHFGYTVQ